MSIEIASFLLSVALGLSLLQILAPLMGLRHGHLYLIRLAAPIALLQFIILMICGGLLINAFVQSDFSVALVINHSHTAQPLLYKITASWGNHEGSLLLWSIVLSLFSCLLVIFGKHLPLALKAKILIIQGLISFCFLSFMSFTSNPFLRQFPPALEGQSLNPILQDPALAFHPPLLYIGYVGLSLVFSFAVAGLWHGQIDAFWARWVRPFVLTAWAFLTAGIALGSWWAYYELGWGGFWFWDPVENASLMPWLSATALLHTAIVVEKRGTMKSWTVLLAIISFALSLMGTFLVRSGVLSSVHAFANDPERGVYILLIMSGLTGLGLLLYSLRSDLLKSETGFAVISREGALMFNNIILMAALSAVFIGTLYPLFIDVFGLDKLTVGPPFFNKSFLPLMIPLFIAVGFGPLLSWKRGRIGQAFKELRLLMVIVLLGLAWLWLIFTGETGFMVIMGLALSFWLIGAPLVALWHRARPHKHITIKQALMQRIWHVPLQYWGMNMAHCGLGFILAGAIGASVMTKEYIGFMNIGDDTMLGGYSITLQNVREVSGPNFVALRGVFQVNDMHGNEIASLMPERRLYHSAGNQETTEAAIHSRLLEDIYVVLGAPPPNEIASNLGNRQSANNVQNNPEDTGFVVRLYIKPFTAGLWFGAGLLVLGACFSLADRRLRMAHGRKANLPE